MDGFLIVDKPKGLTSQAVCLRLKKSLGLEKCGHSGTLDPNTTGVLVVACNQATRLLKLIHEHDKTYAATIVFGYDSKTLDIDSEITRQIDMDFSMAELQTCVDRIAEWEEQIPPMTSAVRINGRRLYEYQREGIELSPKPRKTKILSYEILSGLRRVDRHLEVDILLSVEKGYYIRSFARDLGQALGGCAILKELRRLKAEAFGIEDAVPLNEISLADMHTIEEVFPFPRVEVNDYIAKLVKNGVMLDERQTNLNEPFYVVNNCDIIAIYEAVEPLKYKPILIFK